jgi:hypothetical protein
VTGDLVVRGATVMSPPGGLENGPAVVPATAGAP